MITILRIQRGITALCTFDAYKLHMNDPPESSKTANLVLIVPDAHVGKDLAVVYTLQLLPVLLHQLRKQALHVLLQVRRAQRWLNATR